MTIDWWTLALQTVNFLVVVWLLTRFLYRPIRRVIDEREAADRKAADEAQAKADAAEAARQDYEAKRVALDETQRQREAELHKAMEKERAQVLAAAQEKADALVADARAKIERERAEAVEKLNDRIADLAQSLAAKALAGTGGEDLARVVAHLEALSDAERTELRQDAAASREPVRLVSASALPEDECRRWQQALSERLGEDLRLGFETDPSLLGGVELHLPHAVLSFSVADRLRRAAKAMKG
jgi:F-type H+-transporting ATPase subunit b